MYGDVCNWGRPYPQWNDDWLPPWGRDVEVHLVGEGPILVHADYRAGCWRSADSTRTWPPATFQQWRYPK